MPAVQGAVGGAARAGPAGAGVPDVSVSSVSNILPGGRRDARRSRAMRRWRRASASASKTSNSTGSASWWPACVSRGTNSSAAVVRPRWTPKSGQYDQLVILADVLETDRQVETALGSAQKITSRSACSPAIRATGPARSWRRPAPPRQRFSGFREQRPGQIYGIITET